MLYCLPDSNSNLNTGSLFDWLIDNNRPLRICPLGLLERSSFCGDRGGPREKLFRRSEYKVQLVTVGAVAGRATHLSEREWLESVEVSFVYSYVDRVIGQFWQLFV